MARLTDLKHASLLAAAVIAPGGAIQAQQEEADRIRPYEENPYYWQYEGEPVLLLGGTWQDNLFNHPTKLEEHLEILQEAGGNYVRNTMSSRNAGNVWAFAQNEDGRYDLDQWNEEYWHRFERFLEITHERGIIVQIEIWDPWDHFEDHQSQGGWSYNPFNPENNVTYTAEESGLPTAVDYAPGPSPSEHPFFLTAPELQDNELVRGYQEAYVDRLLSIALNYPHVLFCMNNETGEHLAWGEYWLRYVRTRAEEKGVMVQTTDMRRRTDITADDHQYIYRQPERYTFVDISQNNTQQGQTHWDRIQAVRRTLAERPRPMNNVKIYTFNGGPEESVQRFWRIVFGGAASARFHRPHPLEDPEDHLKEHGSGIGLSPLAQTHLKSMRMLTDAMDVFVCEPRNGLLSEREDNEAYLMGTPGEQYAVYFPDGGEVILDLSGAEGAFTVRWLDIDSSEWQEPQPAPGGGTLELEAPGDGHWAALILSR